MLGSAHRNAQEVRQRSSSRGAGRSSKRLQECIKHPLFTSLPARVLLGKGKGEVAWLDGAAVCSEVGVTRLPLFSLQIPFLEGCPHPPKRNHRSPPSQVRSVLI